jgi:hypothetical protein
MGAHVARVRPLPADDAVLSATMKSDGWCLRRHLAARCPHCRGCPHQVTRCRMRADPKFVLPSSLRSRQLATFYDVPDVEKGRGTRVMPCGSRAWRAVVPQLRPYDG